MDKGKVRCGAGWKEFELGRLRGRWIEEGVCRGARTRGWDRGGEEAWDGGAEEAVAGGLLGSGVRSGRGAN